MHAPTDLTSRPNAVRSWLIVVAALVFAMVALGGATRLTQSGLSIVEWKPVTGTLPPLSAGQWQNEFQKYQEIPQYKQLNRGMSLAEFKTIYWWEWSHRLLGRLIGAVFLLPLLWFLWRGWIGRGLRARLWVIFALGGLQGAVGWWMVASGLAQRLSVSQYRLGAHLLLACLLYVALVWTAQRLARHETPPASRRIRFGAIGLVALVLLQIYLGALVAGSGAGLAYNTWPGIDGSFVPSVNSLLFMQPAWRNFFENTLTIQFDHRMVAYTLWIVTLLHVVDVAAHARAALRSAGVLFGIMTFQAALGITTLLHQAPLSLSLMHQVTAIAVLTLAVFHAERLTPRAALQPRHLAAPEAVPAR